MTAAEMQALAPAPEGCEWGGAETLRDSHSGDVRIRWHYVIGRRVLAHLADGGLKLTTYSAVDDTPLDALLSLRRLAGHLWPWPGWPVVQGVRPAGWGPAPGIGESRRHHGAWLYRDGGRIRLTYHPLTLDTGDCCAIDRDGRWVEVDTRGAR